MIDTPLLRALLPALALSIAPCAPQVANAQALKDIKGAIKNTGDGIKQSGEYIKDGAVKTGEAIGEGVEATGEAIDNAMSDNGASTQPAQPLIAEGDVPTPQEKPAQEDAAQETRSE